MRLERSDGPALLELAHTAFDAEEWRKALTDPDLDQRERSYRRFLDEASGNPEARAALEAWKAEGSDCLAWTARLALGELERRERSPFGPWMRSRIGSPFDVDFFDDPFFSGRGFRPLRPGLMDELERQFDDLLRGARPLPGGTGTQHSERFEMESGPDGVKVRVHSDVDGQEETRIYEAQSLEALLEAHPELREKIDVGTQAPRVERDELRALVDRLQRGTPMRTDVLGVLLDAEGAGDELGLSVESVLPGTLAEALGVQPGDLLLDLNGHELWSVRDVTQALRERAPADEVRLELIDGEGARVTRTWKPSRF